MGRRVGVGEDLAPNKQVRQRVVYIAGGPDVSQEAPLEIRAIFCSAFPPPLKKLGDQGRSLDGGDRHPNRLVSNHFGHQQQQSTITRQSKTKTNKWPSSTLESSETFLPPPRPSEERRLRAQCVYSLHCQQHARAAGCARPPAHTHTHRHTHIQTHTQIRVGGAAARDSASLRESARHAGACSSAAAAAPRLEPRATRSPPASARPGYLCGDRGRRLRLPPAPPGAPPHSRQQLPGLARGCVVWGLLPRRRGCHLPGRCPGVPRRGKFLHPHSGALHLRTPPRPSHLHAGPGCDFAPRSSSGVGGKVSPQPQRSARRGGCDMCQISAWRRGRVPYPVSPLVVLFHFAL